MTYKENVECRFLSRQKHAGQRKPPRMSAGVIFGGFQQALPVGHFRFVQEADISPKPACVLPGEMTA
jgi:hypothetical protein